MIDGNHQLVRDSRCLDLVAEAVRGLDPDQLRKAYARASLFVPESDCGPLRDAVATLAVVKQVLAERRPTL